MDKSARHKAKNKTSTTKPKTVKKRKSDGPTCSMFLAELTRKLAYKKKQEEKSKDIVQTVINSITNALPVKISRKSPEKKESPIKIEKLQVFAPELLPNNTLHIPYPEINIKEELEEEIEDRKQSFKMPKMPLVNSDIIKQAVEKRRKLTMENAAVNTVTDHDVVSELTKHVGTLRKISLIAEEFNQKTARNLKDIVDSVQEDLLRKLEEIEAERKAAKRLEKPVQIDERIATIQE
ncbi:uncharacterized protein LOC113511961 [Galleria mellonella]|uniref:Uncharacterized protein LOC113511961 n=1 Tax=Galleria mellonella TaxID=7137 RepID=A0A6J1WKR4_GALME|nr:uncharacterized protein LOC113511961 [Galleria mellonella]